MKNKPAVECISVKCRVNSLGVISGRRVDSRPGCRSGPLPSLAPMLEKVLPAVVSVRVEGTASQGQKIPEEFKSFW